MPMADIDHDYIKVDKIVKEVKKKIEYTPSKIDYDKIKKELESILPLVATGTKYFPHMTIKGLTNSMLDIIKTNKNINKLKELNDKIIYTCNNPRNYPKTSLVKQLKHAKNIEKLLK